MWVRISVDSRWISGKKYKIRGDQYSALLHVRTMYVRRTNVVRAAIDITVNVAKRSDESVEMWGKRSVRI